MSDFHTMALNSGRVFTPLNKYDVLEEIRREMGEDVYEWAANQILEFDRDAAEFNSDYACMEGEVESWHNFVDEISDEIEQLREKIEDNKLTKAKISIELYKIYEKMRKEL